MAQGQNQPQQSGAGFPAGGGGGQKPGRTPYANMGQTPAQAMGVNQQWMAGAGGGLPRGSNAGGFPGIGPLPGGSPKGLSDFQTPVGPVENYMSRLVGSGALNPASALGPGGQNFAGAMAAGQIPPQLMRQYQQQQQQIAANVADSMRGQRFGSDYAGALARQQNIGLTNLGAQTEQNALGSQGLLGQLGQQGIGNNLGTLGTLLQSELARSGSGLNLAMQQAGLGTGTDPMAMIMGLLGLGGSQGNTLTKSPINWLQYII